MKTRRIPMIPMRWLIVLLAVALVPWLAIAKATTTMDEESDQAALGRELFEAAQLGDLALVKTLLGKGADLNGRGSYTPLIAAASGGHLGVVELLLERGADVNAKTTHYETALMEAARNCHLEVVKLLLDKGADVTAISAGNHEKTLKAAHQHGCKEIVALLKAHGAKEQGTLLLLLFMVFTARTLLS